MAWRVDDVDIMAGPLTICGCRGDGYTALALQFHRIHRGADAILALDIVHDPNSLGVEKDALSQRGFAGIDMCADSYVSYASQVPDQSRNLFLEIQS